MTRYRVPGTLQVVVFVEASDPDDAVAVATDLATEAWTVEGKVEADGDVEEAGGATRYFVKATIPVEASVTADTEEEAQQAFEALSGGDWAPTGDVEIEWSTFSEEEPSDWR